MPKYKKTHKAVNPDATIEDIRKAVENLGYFLIAPNDLDRYIRDSVSEGKSHGYMQGLERASKCQSIDQVRDLYWWTVQNEQNGW